MIRLLALALVFVSATAAAQYNGPAVQSCLAYAKRELRQGGTKAQEVLFERDANLTISRYTRKLGNQFISSVLTGNGAVVLEGSPSAELSFICLLADEKRPVFFWWLPRQGGALAQCTRSEALRKEARACLEFLGKVADQDLGEIYGLGAQEARARGDAAVEAHQNANRQWLAYRDAECARQAALGRDMDPDLYKMACEVDLARRRVLDMKP